MRLTDRLWPALLRWDRVLTLAAIALPLILSVILGFFWMAEHGYLIHYIVASITIGAIVALVRLLTRRSRKNDRRGGSDAPAKLHVPADPNWGAAENRAYSEARALIGRMTDEPVAWDQFQTLAIEVIKTVAKASGPRGREPLDFTIPEALLLVERVTSRVRGDIRHHVPFADTISIGTLEWLWRHKEWGRFALSVGQNAWRVVRFVKSPPAAILREIDGELAGGHSSYLTSEAMAVGQAIVLEEIAKAAVDLYSGRLRFSDSELLELRLAYGDIDRARLATPDAPIRIAVGGQVSAGKSSVINAILAEDVAETDAPPTTNRATTYNVQLGGMGCVLLDLPGLDGGKAAHKSVLQQLIESDIVIWTVRANRPARAIDRALLGKLAEYFAENPQRRQPPFLAVATCVDTLIEDWPLPEHHLSPEARGKIADAVNAIGTDLDADPPLPVSLVDPEWNVDTLRTRLKSVLGEGLMVQRNRARIDGGKRDLSREAMRASRGLGHGLTTFGRRFLHRSTPWKQE